MKHLPKDKQTPTAETDGVAVRSSAICIDWDGWITRPITVGQHKGGCVQDGEIAAAMGYISGSLDEQAPLSPFEVIIEGELLSPPLGPLEALQSLMNAAGNARDDAGWNEIHKDWPIEVSMGIDIGLIVSECSEGFENVRRGCPPDKHLPQFSGITVEIVDVIIRAVGFAKCYNLPIAAAFVAKLKFNAERPDHKKEARNAPGGKMY